MKESNFDDNIKTLIEEGQQPASHLWSQLASRLDEAALQQKKARRNYWSYAAIVLLALGIGSVLLPSDETIDEKPIKKIVSTASTEDPLKRENNSEKFTLTTKKVNTDFPSDRNPKLSKKQLLPLKVTIRATALQSFQSDLSENDLNTTELLKLLTDKETEALLKAALQELARQEGLDTLKLQQTAQGLLASVEAEVEREATLKYRILELLKTGVSNLEYVVSNK